MDYSEIKKELCGKVLTIKESRNVFYTKDADVVDVYIIQDVYPSNDDKAYIMLYSIKSKKSNIPLKLSEEDANWLMKYNSVSYLSFDISIVEDQEKI